VKALSIKQPWATLLVHGRKTIEVRRWQLRFRGQLLIHAARISDDRDEAWQRVPDDLREQAQKVGGIVGVGRLDDCKVYRNLGAFVADQAKHLNDPSWFEPSGLFGLCFSELRPLPFQVVKGNVKLFDVDLDEVGLDLTPSPHKPDAQARGSVKAPSLALQACDPSHGDTLLANPSGLTLPAHPALPGLLVSVRSAAEAKAALAGGAAIIDVKEPDNGALGRASPDVLANILAEVAGRRPVSAALGELPAEEVDLPANLASLSFVKWGLAGWRGRGSAWKEQLLRLREQVETHSSCRAVAVAYADWKLAGAPPVLDVGRFAVSRRWSVLLVDTWQKDGSTLLDWMSLTDLKRLREQTRAVGVKLALAGSLGEATIQALAPVAPEWFAVRGAACAEGQRSGCVEEQRVRRLVEMVNQTVGAVRDV
jgi:uncharacterized protein (UPF0264 family)